MKVADISQKLIEDISGWIREKVIESKQKGVVVGLSGGIDSAVVAGLCKKTLGDKVLGLIMPCHSLNQDTGHALLLAGRFNIKTETVDLSKAYDALVSLLPEGNSLSYANIKPRLRMITLYYFANLHNYLVVGTGNKSEVSVGYFTKHGDGGVDIMPIADLLKKEVVALAKELEVPSEIIDKLPSAGLWDGQTDEDEMGIAYEELDSFLEGKLHKDIHKPVFSKIEEMMFSSQHKRQGPDKYIKS